MVMRRRRIRLTGTPHDRWVGSVCSATGWNKTGMEAMSLCRSAAARPTVDDIALRNTFEPIYQHLFVRDVQEMRIAQAATDAVFDEGD
jgi:hypothetical protein